MVKGCYIFHCTHQNGHKHTAVGNRLEQTPAPLSGLVNRWGKSQLLWQTKHNNTSPLGGRRKEGDRKIQVVGVFFVIFLLKRPAGMQVGTHSVYSTWWRWYKEGNDERRQRKQGWERLQSDCREKRWCRENPTVDVRSQPVNPGGNERIDTEPSPSVSFSAVQSDWWT